MTPKSTTSPQNANIDQKTKSTRSRPIYHTHTSRHSKSQSGYEPPAVAYTSTPRSIQNLTKYKKTADPSQRRINSSHPKVRLDIRYSIIAPLMVRNQPYHLYSRPWLCPYIVGPRSSAPLSSPPSPATIEPYSSSSGKAIASRD